jgi:hypothetical protein
LGVGSRQSTHTSWHRQPGLRVGTGKTIGSYLCTGTNQAVRTYLGIGTNQAVRTYLRTGAKQPI